MSLRNAVIVVIDRLGAGFLGPYGATWLNTPALNRLASQSLLIEHGLSDSPELMQVYRSFWTGRHAAKPDAAAPTLAELLAAAGQHPWLLTDDRSLAEHPLAAGFHEQLLVPRRSAQEAASGADATQLAEVLGAAGQYLFRLEPPFLFWIHAEGMQGAWDAPYELRTQWTDEGDPAPPDFVEPPARRLPKKVDPDELLGVMHAYAAQVTVLDECFESFFNTFLESPHAQTTLLAFTSPRGYPLGEHRRIGSVDPALYGEALRTPLLLRFPDGAGAAYRAQAITQPPDLFATLADWMGLAYDRSQTWGRSLAPLAQGDAWPRDRALAAYNHQRAIRTPAWFLRQSTSLEEETPQLELYVKPDDQWEINEVSDRVPTVVEELTAALDNLEQAIATNDESLLTPLSELLREGV